LDELAQLMHAFKFNVPDRLTYSYLKEEFKFNLKSKTGELKDHGDETIVRFDLIRDIFLERGL